MSRIHPEGHASSNGGQPKPRIPDQKGIQDGRTLPDAGFDGLWDSVVLPATVKGSVARASGPELHSARQAAGGLPPSARHYRSRWPSRNREDFGRSGPCIADRCGLEGAAASPTSRSNLTLWRARSSVRVNRPSRTFSARSSPSTLPRVPASCCSTKSRRSPPIAGKMSLEANPVDVHRATDAVLAQLDQLAANNPQPPLHRDQQFRRRDRRCLPLARRPGRDVRPAVGRGVQGHPARYPRAAGARLSEGRRRSGPRAIEQGGRADASGWTGGASARR